MSQAVNENPTIEEQTWWYGKGLAMREDHAAYLREWAADIRKNSGSSVDADQLDSTAAHIDGLEAALRDCLEIAGSDCEHDLCKAIIKRASPFDRER